MAFLFCLALACPQEPATAETVVTAPRARRIATDNDAAVVVVTREELLRTGERSLPRALGKAAGVWVQETNLGGGAPILRGQVGNQVLIVVDGVRLNDSTTRQGPNQALNGIDAATVERVEVLRGPRSVLYGSDALGGAILIWTRSRSPAPDGAIRAEIDESYSSVDDGVRGALALSGAGAHDGWMAILGHQDWGDLRTGGGHTEDHTGYLGHSWFGSWEHALSAHRRLRLSAARTRDFDVPRTDRLNTGFGQTQPADVEHHFELQDRERYVVSLTDDGEGVLADEVQYRLSLRRYDERRRIRANGSSTLRLEEDETQTVGLGVDLRKGLGKGHLLTYGLDLDLDQVDSTRDNVNINTGTITPGQGAFAPDSRYVSGGVFLQDEILAFEEVDLTAGLRYSRGDFAFDDFTTGSRVDGDFDALTASLQGARDVGRDVRLSGTLAQGFRAPNLSDLARNGSFFGGTELANPDLEPEVSFLAEVACEVVRASWKGALAVYFNTISDLVGRVLVDPGGPQQGDEIYRRENVGSLEYSGAELRGERALTASWDAYLSAEYVYGVQYDDLVDPTSGQKIFNGEPGQRVPPANGKLGLRFAPERPWRRIGWAELAYVWALDQERLSPGDLGDPRIDPDGTDGWHRLDLDFGGPLGILGSSWTLGLHNLWDEPYRVHGSGFDAPGVGIVVGVHLQR